MSIAVIGLSHKTANISIRERIAIPEYQLLQTLHDFRTQVGHHDILIVSTCNRTEVYTSYPHFKVLLHWLALYHHILPESLEPYVYYYEGLEALTHAMKVSASLDSMVLGEPQIFGQMKKAFTISAQAGYLSHHLERAFQYVFSAAKDVRSRTEIGHCPVSVAYHAAFLAKDHLYYPAAQRVIIIGAGGSAALLTQHIRSIGCHQLTIVNRSLEKAQLLAEHMNVSAAPLSKLPSLLKSADLVLSATESPEYIITEPMIREAMKPRIKDTPLLLIDIANPRDIDPAVASIPNVWLYNLDDLHRKIEHNTQKRQSTIHYAEKIIQQHQEAYLQDLRSRNSIPAIKNIRSKAEQLKAQELQNSLKLLEQGKSPEEVLSRLANRLTQKWLHQPCINLRDASMKGDHHLLDAALKLFEEPVETSVGD